MTTETSTIHVKQGVPLRDLEIQNTFNQLVSGLAAKKLPERSDVTAYLQESDFPRAKQPASPSHGEPEAASSVIPNVSFFDRLCDAYGERGDSSLDFGGTSEGLDYRVQASKCFRGAAWSFTIRRKITVEQSMESTLKQWSERLESGRANSKGKHPLAGFRPSEFHLHDATDPPNLASLAEISRKVLELLPSETGDSRLTGLLLITGETSCGKSLIARGMIYRYLTQLSVGVKDRNPHLVTYEDPIEDWFWRPELLGNARFMNSRRLDYTPRQKGRDCKNFKECTRAALRQTPSVFFAGEIREPRDLAEAVFFGGTGHLIVATAHAGSLSESADTLLSALKVSNSNERAVHIPKILGIVHLRKMKVKFSIQSPKKATAPVILKSSMIMPAVYRRCPPGVQGFVADGLASLLPHCPRAGEWQDVGSLGRQFLVRHILSDQVMFEEKPGLEILPGKRAELKVWMDNWQRIRKFHAGPYRQNDDRIRLSADPALEELWVQCVREDVKGAR